MKDKCDDADVILVSHGHFDHSGGAPKLVELSKAAVKNPQIMCTGEMMHYYVGSCEVPEQNITCGNKGSPYDFGFC